nr:MAG TPA_asm: hypothetical protein [Caudoviricetes sp.]
MRRIIFLSLKLSALINRLLLIFNFDSGRSG